MNTENITKLISEQRLKPYLDTTGNDLERAYKLYKHNILLSESFYVAFHNFEIVLRNVVHNSLSKKYGNKWYLNAIVQYGDNKKDHYIIDKLKEIEKILIGRDKKYPYGTEIEEIEYFDIISNLSFGFWKSLFIHNRDNICWKPCLKHEFKTKNRRLFYQKIDSIIKLRNRIFHHEKIINKDLIVSNRRITIEEIYNSVIEILNIFSPYLAERTQELSRFNDIYKRCKEFR